MRVVRRVGCANVRDYPSGEQLRPPLVWEHRHMTQTPAGWFVDPQDATQLRYWDGTAWTDHRAPRGATTTDQLGQAGADLADGLAKGFTAVGNWVNQNVATPAATARPTFASVAASCREEPARQPLSATAQLVLSPADLAGVAAVFARTATPVTPEGARLDNELGRLVPNPWDPADPQGVAVFVGPGMVGRLPADLEAAYCPRLAPLASQGLLATCVVDLFAQGSPGAVTAARATVELPEVSAFA